MIEALFALALFGSDPELDKLAGCDELCLYQKPEHKADKGNAPKPVVEAYRPYIKCFGQSMNAFTYLVEVGKEQESVRNAMKMAYVACENERKLADQTALTNFNGKLPKEYASREDFVQHHRSKLIVSLSAVWLLERGLTKYLAPYINGTANASN